MRKGIGSRLRTCAKAPLRILCGMRDLYVKGMTRCAGTVSQYNGGGIYNCPNYSEFVHGGGFGSGRSDCSEDDLRELIRVASESRIKAELRKSSNRVRRSQSAVVFGRIDEDRPCDFAGEVKVGSSLSFPKSRSIGAGRAWRDQ